jgi:hypothetical protein
MKQAIFLGNKTIPTAAGITPATILAESSRATCCKHAEPTAAVGGQAQPSSLAHQMEQRLKASLRVKHCNAHPQQLHSD